MSDKCRECGINQPIRPIVNNIVVPISQVQQTMKNNCGWNYNHERFLLYSLKFGMKFIYNKKYHFDACMFFYKKFGRFFRMY